MKMREIEVFFDTERNNYCSSYHFRNCNKEDLKKILRELKYLTETVEELIGETE